MNSTKEERMAWAQEISSCSGIPVKLQEGDKPANCPITLPVGTRVILSREARRANILPNTERRSGTVTGYSNDGKLITVKRDGYKLSRSYAVQFWEQETEKMRRLRHIFYGEASDPTLGAGSVQDGLDSDTASSSPKT